MPYLIDGHNLIPKIPNLSLESLDDEIDLVIMLQEFCQRRQKQVEVFFDNAPPGQPRTRNFGNVIARFVASPLSADQAIHSKLIRLGASARNWTVVSSDHAVQSYGRAAKAAIITSEAFARQLITTLNNPSAKEINLKAAPLSESEIDEWMDIFSKKSKKS